MNRLFNTLMVSVFAALLAACAPESSRLPEIPSLEASSDVLLFSEAGGSETVSFTTNRPWTAEVLYADPENDEQWCTVSSQKGAAGDNSINVRVAALYGDYREIVILLNASASGKEILVKQSGQPVIVNNPAADVTESYALLSGKWNYSGELQVAETGIVLTPAGGAERYIPCASDESGVVSVEVSDLAPQTTYSFSVYVLDAAGTRYTGESREFVTEAAPVLESIADLKAAGYAVAVGGLKTLAESMYFEGVVVRADDVIYVQDDVRKHSGIAVTIGEGFTCRKGDKISVRTKGAVLSHSTDNLVSLDVPAKNVALVASGQSAGYAKASHEELADYEAMQVEVENTQLTKLFTDLSAYPDWKSSSCWTFEVNGSEKSYNVVVPENASIASQAPATRSGSLKGVVSYVDALKAEAVVCSEAADIAGLVNERFESLLEFSYATPYFEGSLTAEEESSGKVVLPYRNGDNSTIEGVVSVTMSAEDETILGTLAVESLENVKIGTGSGRISFKVSGTPAATGVVTFTINGISDLNENSCTAEITAPILPVVGNYEVIWNMSTAKGATKAVVSKNDAAATATDLVLTASASNISGTKWNELGAIGWNSNTADNYITAPVQYYQFSLAVASGKRLSLSGMDITQRISGGDVELSVQYSLDGTSFSEIKSYTLTSNDSAIVVNLGKVKALTAVPEGTTVTFRLVPMSTNSATKWGIKVGSRFAVYGNAE